MSWAEDAKRQVVIRGPVAIALIVAAKRQGTNVRNFFETSFVYVLGAQTLDDGKAIELLIDTILDNATVEKDVRRIARQYGFLGLVPRGAFFWYEQGGRIVTEVAEETAEDVAERTSWGVGGLIGIAVVLEVLKYLLGGSK